tara:strand:+ start:69271 stop:70041 length:771 start_codon:yes stop_codon:yes gene_type:complete
LKTLGIIPARMASSRFPNKPMAKINGMPMIGHVYHRARMCKNLSDVYVATCDKIIIDYVTSIGGKAILTKNTHETASERIAEAFQIINTSNLISYNSIMLIQGDEPLLNPIVLDEMIGFHNNKSSGGITNLICEINDIDIFNDPNVVKVVKNKDGRILYFSRSAIPYNFKGKNKIFKWKQTGLILFDIQALEIYAKYNISELEKVESVDMNRALENNIIINAYPVKEMSHAVDIPEDIIIVSELMVKDILTKLYLN